MSGKQVRLHAPARAALRQGLNALADAVRVTLGPGGRNVLIERPGRGPIVTKDGVTVAHEIELADRLVNTGALLARNAASRTAEDVGDGTTTATVLAQAILRAGVPLVAAGVSPTSLKRGIDRAAAACEGALKAQARKVLYREDVTRVATVSANGDAAVGELIGHAMEQVGRDGRIEVDDGRTLETTLELGEGVHWDRGFVHRDFVTDAARGECVLENPYILLNQLRLRSLRTMAPLFEALSRSGRPILIVSEGVEGDALATLLLNKEKLKPCAVQCGYYGNRRVDFLHDLAAMTGAQALTEDRGVKLESITLEMLGSARRVVVTRDSTVVIGGEGGEEALKARVDSLRAQQKNPRTEMDARYLRERIAKLVGGVATIHVGGAVESEVRERKGRIEDALHAAVAAVEEGVVPGGGVALLRCRPAVKALGSGPGLDSEEQLGVDIVSRALEAPLWRIAANAHHPPAVVVRQVSESQGAVGWDAQTGTLCDLFERGIVDATKVVRRALECGASVAGMILTAEAMIIQTRAVASAASDDESDSE
jgi:chaperonin GroEL